MSFSRTVLALAAGLTLAPAPAVAQHAQPSGVVAARSDGHESGHVQKVRQPSASRHALIGAVSGAIGGVLVLAGLERAYGGAPVVIVAACIGGGATIGAVGGLAVYGIKRLAGRG